MNIKKNNLETEKSQRKLEGDELEFKPINITYEVSCLKNIDNSGDYQEFFTLIDKSLKNVEKTLLKLINVTRLSTYIQITDDLKSKLNDTKCYDTLKENKYNSDLLIIIKRGTHSHRIFGKPDIIKTIDNGRPIIGVISFNLGYHLFESASNRNKENLLNIIFLHESTHILGFKKSIFEDKQMIDTINISRINNVKKEKLIIKSPKVLNISRIFFNCSQLRGIELDNETLNEGSEYLHWEGRILLGDYMSSDIYFQEQVISEITLALLEDLGWYKVNYYTGGLMRFGKFQGCDFFTKDCINNDNLFPNEFCTNGERFTCSSGRLSRGYCDIYNDIDDDYYTRNNYYKNLGMIPIGYGGAISEYCPKGLEYNFFNSQSNNLFKGNCNLGEDSFGNEMSYNYNQFRSYSDFNNSFLEIIGDNSFCALSSVLKKKEIDNNTNRHIYEGIIRPTCYQMFCSDKSLTIQIDTEYVVCPKEGGLVKIEGNYTKYTGYLYCPDYNLICTGTKICNNLFDCVEKESEFKITSFEYNEYQKKKNSSIQLSTKIDTEIEDIVDEAYELSENGKCPLNCKQCKSNKQCIICRNGYKYYIGIKENDNNPINCSYEGLGKGFYRTEKYESGKIYYFKCIDNCDMCDDTHKDTCNICAPTHYLENGICKERIIGCLDYNISSVYNDILTNNGGPGYKKCLNCNNSGNYYCLNNEKEYCNLTEDYNSQTFYNLEAKDYPCVKRCEEGYLNCLKCNNQTCTDCKTDKAYIKNFYGNCIEDLAPRNCEIQNKNVNYTECSKCKTNYYCIGNILNNATCTAIDNIKYYYYLNDNAIQCIERCNNTFDHCLECNLIDKCTKCENDYFVYQGECIKNITGCIDNFYNGIKKECNECNKNDKYYCINKEKTICYKINDISSYYLLPNINYSCYNSCDTLVDNCLKCNQTNCHECTEKYIINNNHSYCLLRPFDIPDNDNCSVRIHDYNKSIYDLDIWDFIDYYWENNIPYIKVVDHFIGNNYTVTIFMNSDCTEELLNQKYFKIDSNELEEIMIKESGVEGMKLLFSIYINYNFKNHFRYHDIESRYLNPYKRCISCLDINYTVTNYFYNAIKKVLGPIVVNLLVSEKIDIIEKDSKIFNDMCKNVTFYGIDLPLKKRLKNLYLHKFSEPILCNAENCTIEEYNYDELTSECKCNYGNSFEDIFAGEKFEFLHYEGEEVKSNDFADSFGIIKCVPNGFHLKNIKANIGFFLCIIAIFAQISLYIYYTFCSKPIINIIKNTYNPPKKSSLFLITDWERNLRNLNNLNEHEIYVQPRDDAEDQLLEEEKSYNNEDIFNTSSVSIDTNVGGANIKKGPDKLILKEKVDNKKVLILLGKNKSKNRDKDKDQLITEDLKSDSDIIPLQEGKDNKLNFCKIYWSVVSLKQHIINYFSNINCCKITESYIPIPIRAIRSIFIFILSFVFNILFLNHTYYENKFEYFNERYIFIHSEVEELKIPISQKIIYAISNTFGKAMISFALLIVVQFFIGFIFFSIRNNVIKTKRKNNLDGIQDLVLKTKLKYLIFFIIDIVLMIIFFLSITGFGGAYGGGFVDYFVAGIISLIFLEIFPFIWSLVIALLRYIGFKKNNKILFKISEFFMF